MFHIELMVEDKNVPKVLWALDGLVVGMPKVLPVRAAAVKNKKVVSTQPLPGASLVNQVKHRLITWPADTIAWPKLVELMLNVGVAKDSKGYIVHTLKKHKFIKATAGGSPRKPTFKILKPNTEA